MRWAHDAVKEQFLRDVSNHKQAVLLDNGVYRHIKFKADDSSNYWFDLITYPGTLMIDGDYGTFVFRRIHDMFEFFRVDADHNKSADGLVINPGYWAEKLIAHPEKGIKELDEHAFTKAIIGQLTEWVRENKSGTTQSERRDLWEAAVDKVLFADGDQRKLLAAYDFHYSICRKRDLAFCFRELWETDLHQYTRQFIWNCFAICWGIKKYETAKDAMNTEVWFD